MVGQSQNELFRAIIKIRFFSLWRISGCKLVFSIIIFVCATQAARAQVVPASYPKITAYVGIVHPVVTFSKNKPAYNFDGTYVAGLATGINLWKSQKIAFSMEFVPFIRAADGTSRMSNFLFHPGAVFLLGHGFTLATRAAFETSGRYGFTPILAKVVKRNKGSSFYVNIGEPVRFGNNLPSTLTLTFQLGVAF